MRTHPFGWTAVPVPVIGQGTWNLDRGDRARAVAALQAGVDAGMTHLDTAESYGSGRVEEIVGEAIAGQRSRVFLVSKVLPQHASYAGVLRACEGSLRRLRTDYLDVYLLHWPGRHPLAETIRAFERLVADGKIRCWGVSNFDVDDLAAAEAIAGPRRIACNQVLYHLRQRAVEHEVIPWCEARGIAVVAYSPFGSGEFPAAGSRAGHVLQQIAAAQGATARQIALAYLVRRDALFAIPKSSSVEHVRENAGARDLELPPETIAQLDAAFPLRPRPKSLPVL